LLGKRHESAQLAIWALATFWLLQILAAGRVANAMEAPTVRSSYSVHDITLGTRILLNDNAYREYKCTPSQQFDGFTWCTKEQPGTEARGNFEALYSLLHSKNGTVVYINRFQTPAYWGATEVNDDIERYSLRIGQRPQINLMPVRSDSLKGTIAVWGQVSLQRLDQNSIAALAKGKAIKRGLLVDFTGDFTRSAREGLPIYSISGGPGFIWAASYDDKGRGTLRFCAVDASAYSTNSDSTIVAPTSSNPIPVPRDTQKGQAEEKATVLGYAENDPASLASHQRLRDELFKDLKANTTKYTFDYVVIDLPAGTVPGINVSVPVSHVRYSDTVFFAFDRYSLEPSAQAAVTDFANTMMKDKSYKSVIVVGHTDAIGTEEYNYTLSKNRAAAVAVALRTDGILDRFLGIVPMGKDQPRTTNSTQEGRALNRRVEFFISDIPAATKIAIEHVKYNPCYRNDNEPAAKCDGGPTSVPILPASGEGRPIAIVDLSRSALPSAPRAVREPLPNVQLERPSIKELQQ